MTRMHCAFLAPELSATSSMLLGWIMARSPRSSRRPAQDLTDAPPLLLRHRARLLDQDPVTDLGRVRLVVGLDLRHEAPLLLARALELTLALHRLGAREISLGLLHPRGVLGHAHGQLEAEV